MDIKVNDLVALARDKSQGARNQLVENIKDLFLSDGARLNDHERALMSDILTKLIVNVESDLRKALAESLADSTVDLPEIAIHLANDDAEIARPILERSKLIQDDDLIAIVKMRTDEHRLAIAIRDGIGVEVSDALIEYGNEDVVEALLQNENANVSESAMEYLVAESRRVDRFQEPLLSRDDLSGELAYRMYWWVSAALRKKIITEFEVEEVVIDSLLQKATNDALSTQLEGGDGAVARAQKLVKRMKESGELNQQFLLQSLRQQRIAVFVAGLSVMGRIDFETAWQIFTDKECESLAIIAVSIGINRSDFTSMYLLLTKARDGTETRSPAALKSIMELYDSITEKTANGALQYWQQNKTYKIAIEELNAII